jgi:hypothetical protein
MNITAANGYSIVIPATIGSGWYSNGLAISAYMPVSSVGPMDTEKKKDATTQTPEQKDINNNNSTLKNKLEVSAAVLKVLETLKSESTLNWMALNEVRDCLNDTFLLPLGMMVYTNGKNVYCLVEYDNSSGKMKCTEME